MHVEINIQVIYLHIFTIEKFMTVTVKIGTSLCSGIFAIQQAGKGTVGGLKFPFRPLFFFFFFFFFFCSLLF